MDPRFYHKDFNRTILDCFDEVITKYNFNVKIGAGFSSVEFSNDKCIIEFCYDSGFLCGDFVDPMEKLERQKIKRIDGLPTGYPKYPIYSVWKWLYPNDKVEYSYKEMDLISQASIDKKLVLERFVNILNGDFTWTKAFKENDARISEKIEFMFNRLKADHPITKKFWSGNPEWEKDFDDYKKSVKGLQK